VSSLVAILLRAAAVLVLLRLFLRFVAALVRGLGGVAAAPPGPAPQSGGDLVRDRVCNTFVPRSRALSAQVAGEAQHFCSAGCRDAALKAARRAS
jgi:hypothetical protein